MTTTETTTRRVLSDEQMQFFDENGYVVVPGAVPPENVQAAVDAVWEFVGMDPNDSSTWYPPDRKGGLVYIHQHQALWDNRQFPRLYGAFADLFGNEKLWVSMDRASMKPPIDARFPEHDDKGFVHWDFDSSKPLSDKLGLQGVLALADTDPDMGGFCCIPGFHRVLAEWIAEQPADRNPFYPDLSRLPSGYKVTPIPMKAGDLVIWNVHLAHGNGRNVGARPRIAQYVTMSRATDNEQVREDRVACWREGHAPSYWEKDIPEKFKGKERNHLPADLTPLGRKLLGVDRW